jgi:hypothetical protein
MNKFLCKVCRRLSIATCRLSLMSVSERTGDDATQYGTVRLTGGNRWMNGSWVDAIERMRQTRYKSRISYDNILTDIGAPSNIVINGRKKIVTKKSSRF